jgi:hypothetical protein
MSSVMWWGRFCSFSFCRPYVAARDAVWAMRFEVEDMRFERSGEEVSVRSIVSPFINGLWRGVDAKSKSWMYEPGIGGLLFAGCETGIGLRGR